MVTVNNRDRLDWREGMTVQELLERMGYGYVLITVTVDGELVPADEYPHFTLHDGADVNVFHLAHGG